MSLKFIDEIKREEENQSLSIPAKRLKEKLEPINSKVEEMTKRWFWELLQNASDYNDNVKVKLTLDNNKITFSHSGKPFRTLDVLNLISPDSGKDGDEIDMKDNIGKFGSGLISTHVLSSIIEVEGIVKKNDEDQHYKFNISLDRSSPGNKSFLQDSIKKTKLELRNNHHLSEYKKGTFQTHFSYLLNKPFNQIDGKKAAIEGINYLITILPYTLCFMRKVLSVEIINKADEFNKFSSFKLNFQSQNDNIITFKKIKDNEIELLDMLYLSYGKVSTAIEIKNNNVVAFPDNMSKLFCGLPLIGTEKVGLPIILNSLNYQPSTERHNIELSPNDSLNREICEEGVELFDKLIKILLSNKTGNLYNIAYVRKTFNGTEPSKIWFKNKLVKSFIAKMLNSSLVVNVKGDNIPLKNAKIPFIDDEHMERFYGVANCFASLKLPEKSSFEAWHKTIDFNLIPSIKYCFENFLSEVVLTSQIDTFSLHNNNNTLEWLKDVFSLITDVDTNLLNKYKIFPNQNKVLCEKESIYFNDDMPEELVEINNSINKEVIENTLLHSDFNDFKDYLTVGSSRGLKFICNRIDESFKNAYAKNDGSPDTFIEPLRKLFKWYNDSDLKVKELKDLFKWFSNKRAVLFLETFNETERDMALNIAQSGKMRALSKLADSGITNEQLSELSNKAHLIETILLALQEEIDDTTYADEETGKIGEKLVYEDLKKKFPEYQGYKVIWSSKELNECRFDFEIRYQENTKYFIDAKTTIRGISNSDSIPFFMRKSQWSFIKTNDAKKKYLLARVFLQNESHQVNYLSINLKNL